MDFLLNGVSVKAYRMRPESMWGTEFVTLDDYRALEAENTALKASLNEYLGDHLRAEKAEASQEQWERAARYEKLLREKAEARIVELEAEIQRWRRRYPEDVSEAAYKSLETAQILAKKDDIGKRLRESRKYWVKKEAPRP
jgi:hypothetical protein